MGLTEGPEPYYAIRKLSPITLPAFLLCSCG